MAGTAQIDHHAPNDACRRDFDYSTSLVRMVWLFGIHHPIAWPIWKST